jgi:wyosine [tRNA(Phe)-imidazoG37] synthetase (radical SAM superfamily)
MTTPLPIHHPVARRAFASHSRLWQQNHYVYPVVSRRSKGISLGINLNPDKVCNFDCIYCSVDRKIPLPPWAVEKGRDVDLSILRQELAAMLDTVRSGEIYHFDPYDKIPAELRRVNDIAFSGDGEPTTCPQFRPAVELAAELAQTLPLTPPVKLVLITNATMLQKPTVRDTLAFLDHHNGEIWAKLDAGTPEYYQLVDRTGVSFDRLLENLRWCCQTRPTVIQTLLMKIHGTAPSPAELAAYAARLHAIRDAGGLIKLVQLYTVSRGPTESYVTPLSEPELEQIARPLRDARFPVEIYP